VIYADPSFLFSLYAWDDNTPVAQKIYAADARRPLCFTPWQRFELKNAVRLAVHKMQRSGGVVFFQPGNVFRRIDEDVAGGLLRHQDPDWKETLRVAEDLSSQHTITAGTGAVDLWHVAAAMLLGVDTFWTFDRIQRDLVVSLGKFKKVPAPTP
jgi:hypothetical protein